MACFLSGERFMQSNREGPEKGPRDNFSRERSSQLLSLRGHRSNLSAFSYFLSVASGIFSVTLCAVPSMFFPASAYFS